MSGLATGHYLERTIVIFTYVWALSRNLCCQNIYASMNKCMFIIVMPLSSKNVPFHNAKSLREIAKESPIKFIFRGIYIIKMIMFNQWWLSHTKDYIKLNSPNQIIAWLSSIQVNAYRKFYIRWSTPEFYIVQQNHSFLALKFLFRERA